MPAIDRTDTVDGRPAETWKQLPPLILHPFGSEDATTQLIEGSKACLALQGAAMSNPRYEELQQRVVLGRYQEIRMLVFLGKDIFRWVDQCMDQMERTGNVGIGINGQMFSAMLVESPPEAVARKLQAWGVTDRRSVFSRAIGIHSMFEEPPDLNVLSPMFLEHYHRFADQAYVCYQKMAPAARTREFTGFDFMVYASEEYSRILAEQWEL